MTRAVALLLTAFTGMSGLVYEVTWEKYLAILVGSHAEATAAVLGLFLGGLSLGYSRFGVIANRLIRNTEPAERVPGLLRLYGLVEAGIGVYALAFPLLFEIARFVSVRVPPGGSGFAETLAFGFDLLLCAALIVPGAFLMGATIPLLTQALATDLDDATRVHARIYAFNTIGAVAGALGAGFVLLPGLGLIRSLQVMAVVNLVAGGLFVWMSRRPAPFVPPQADERVVAEAPPDLRFYSAIGLLAGFAMMTLQTVVIRLSGLSFGASPYTFSMVVAIFVLGIAIGSFIVGALPKVPRGALAINLWIQAALLLGLYLVLDSLPYYVYVLRGLFRSIDPAFPAYVTGGLALIAALVGPAAVFSGATLPLVFHELRDRFGELGAAAGSLYSWNTVGSLLGAVLGGYALFFVLDLPGVYKTALVALVVAAGLATWRGFDLSAVRLGVGLVPLLIGLLMLPAWSIELLSAGLFRERRPPPDAFESPASTIRRQQNQNILYYDDDPVASIKVIQIDGPAGMSRSIYTNGKSDGNTIGDYPTMSLAGLLPVILGVGEPERAFVIGFGTGVTAGELAVLPTMEEVVVAEISPAVANAAPLFDFSNQNASTHPKVRMVRSDAYRALLRSPHRFDVIVSEPSNPWMAGVDMLFTQEFLEAARDRLTDGGVYAQWYHQYETSDEAVALVVRTYTSVFDRVAVWYGKGSDLLLFGIKGSQPLPDLIELQRRMQQPAMQAGLERSGIRNIAQLAAHELLPEAVVRAGELSGPLHHLTHPRLGFEAGRAFFRGREARLPFLGAGEPRKRGRAAALLPRILAGVGDQRSRDLVYRDYVLALCGENRVECIATLGAWERDHPDSELRKQTTRGLFSGPDTKGLDPKTLDHSRLLFEPRPPDAPQRMGSRELDKLNDLFVNVYHHASPFDPRALRALWNRCVDKKPGDCERGRAEANRILTTIGVERGMPGKSRDR